MHCFIVEMSTFDLHSSSQLDGHLAHFFTKNLWNKHRPCAVLSTTLSITRSGDFPSSHIFAKAKPQMARLAQFVMLHLQCFARPISIYSQMQNVRRLCSKQGHSLQTSWVFNHKLRRTSSTGMTHTSAAHNSSPTSISGTGTRSWLMQLRATSPNFLCSRIDRHVNSK